MWGQVPTIADKEQAFRIIPTRVGTSVGAWLKNHLGQDHPHACGDKDKELLYMSSSEGSSPRVWGQAVCRYNSISKRRIIPTRVGTRYNDICMHAYIGDHPHACGDKIYAGAYLLPQIGSSPRVWGQVLFILPLSSIDRIIPTRVGTSIKQFTISYINKDHPHACGDKGTGFSMQI